MMPPAWMLPATVKLDEAQRDDAPLAKARHNLAVVYEIAGAFDHDTVRLIVASPPALRIACDAVAEAYAADTQHVAALMHTALRLRAKGLAPADVTWEPEIRDGVLGWWMRVP